MLPDSSNIGGTEAVVEKGEGFVFPGRPESEAFNMFGVEEKPEQPAGIGVLLPEEEAATPPAEPVGTGTVLQPEGETVVPPSETVMGGAEEAIIEEPVLIEHPVQKGDNLWNIIKEKLESQKDFEGMNAEQKTHLIDAMKDKFAKMSEEDLIDIGIKSGNIDELTAGVDKIDLSSVLGDKEMVGEAVNDAQTLSEEAQDTIGKNNQKIIDYRVAHEGEALTSEKIEEILHPTPEVVDQPVVSPPPEVSPQPEISTQPELSSEAMAQVQQQIDAKIEDIYGREWWHIGRSQTYEWTGDPGKGIVGIKDMEATTILKGEFGEHFGRTMDAVESGNRKQLLEFLSETKETIGDPTSGETTEVYMRRGLEAKL